MRHYAVKYRKIVQKGVLLRMKKCGEINYAVIMKKKLNDRKGGYSVHHGKVKDWPMSGDRDESGLIDSESRKLLFEKYERRRN